MSSTAITKPYLILPKLIEQPTWGGDYIVQQKGWATRPTFHDKKIGQSYELYSGSLLAIDCTDSADERFGPEGSALTVKTITLADLIAQDPEAVLGQARKNLSLLIKFTQALGNSFQLHVKPGTEDPHWQPKPESWYFLEPGLATLGLQPNSDVANYQAVYIKIDQAMQQLSRQVLDKELTLVQARQQAHELVLRENPWQFVNKVTIPKHSLIDLSAGGLHHSWEDNSTESPLGNVVYEIQVDQTDEASTIRCFDQGKIKDDGTIRPIQIDDYFKFLDTNLGNNVPSSFFRHPKGNHLLSTKYYSLDIIDVQKDSKIIMPDSLCHLFVRDGNLRVKSNGQQLRMTTGHSCFIPAAAKSFLLTGPATVLMTYIKQ